MASLPSVSNASYWQYKEDTSYVLKWIEQTAKACGWKKQQTKQTTPAPSSGGLMTQSRTNTSVPTKETNGSKMATTSGGSGRLKGKDRKAAKQRAAAEISAANEKKKKDEDERGIVLTALEILEQANLISAHLTKSDSSAYRPPSSVIHALGRAIKLRQSFSNWFETTRPHDHKSNSAHRYFIKILEKIAGLFLQAIGTTTVNSDEFDTTDIKSGAVRAVNQNRYESLLERAVQDVRDEPEDGPVRPTKSSGLSIKEEAATSSRKYHMEVKDSQENAFMVFTLFTDLHDIRAEIKCLWKRCFKDGADMVIATVLTAQALAIVQRSEDRIMSALDDTKFQEGVLGQEDQRNCAWSFSGTYCRLLSTLRDPTDIEAVLRFEDSSHKYGNEGEAVSMLDLTFAFSARRLSDLTKLNRIGCRDPLLLQFEHNPRALLNADVDKVLERDRGLCCTLIELAKLRYVLPPQTPSKVHSEDNRRFESVRKDPILGSLHPVWMRKEVNLTSVFAAEIMLDIKEICNAFPASRPSYDDMYDSYMNLLGLKMHKVPDEDELLPICKEGSPLARGVGSDGWEDKVCGILAKVFCILPVHNTAVNDRAKTFCSIPVRSADGMNFAIDVPWRDEFDVDCKKSVEVYKGLDPLALKYSTEEYRRARLFKFVFISTGAFYLVDNYPIFTTSREAFMQTLTESAGIEILNANKHETGAMAHLYNASRQLGLGNLRWPAMDRIIDLHKVALFAGDLPTTPAAMLKSFSHRYWGPKGRMSRKEKTRRMNRAITLMKPSAMTQAYNEHWDTAGRIPFWYTLESNALAAAATEKKAGKKRPVSPSLSFIESIPVIEEYLAKQLQDVRVDYMEVDRVGQEFNKILHKHARGVFQKQGNRVIPDEADDRWSGIDFVSESFEQEAQLHEAMSRCGGDPSKLPVQDCDYLQDSINCLANALRAKGIGGCPNLNATDGEAVNMPTSLTRFRIRGSEDLPDMRRLVLVSHCSCCHRKHYF